VVAHPRRGRGARRPGWLGRCSHEEDENPIGAVLPARSMRAPTLWEGFGNNAREVSQTRAVCCRVASDSAVLRVSRAMHVVTAVMR